MSNDSEVSVKIGADLDDSGFQAASGAAAQLDENLQGIQGAAAVGTEGLDAAAAAATAFGSSVAPAVEAASELSSSLSSMGAVAAGVLGGLQLEGIVDKFKDFFTSSIFGAAELGEKLQNLSESTGISTDDLQVLRFAAESVGVSFDKVQMVVNRVSLAMLQFSEGSKTAINAASVLGIDPTTFTDAYDALTKIGERVKEIGTLTLEQRGALEQWIGGRGGATFLPVLEQLDEAKTKIDALNLSIDPGQVKANAAAAEKVNILGSAFEHLKDTIGGDLTGALASVSDYLTTQVQQLSLTTDQYNQYVAAIRAGASEMVAMKVATSGAGEPNPSTGFSPTGPRSGGAGGDEQLQAAQETQAQLKGLFEQTVNDFEAAQRLIVAQAGDTAEARMAAEDRIVGFLISHEAEAAAAGVDLNEKIAAAAIAGASAQNASIREQTEMWKQQGEQVQAIVRQEATDQLNALDTMYTDFKGLASDVLEHVKEKWGELNAAEQVAKQDLKDTTTEIGDILAPIGSSFDELFNSMLASGTKTTITLTQEFQKMAQSITEDLIKSGIKDLLTGGKEGSIGGALSTALTGQSGGLAGELAKAFEGSAIATGLKTALTTAWTGIEAPIANVFGQAWTAISGIVRNVFGSALQGAGSSVVSAGASAAGSAVASSPEVTAIATSTATISAALVALGATITADLSAETIALVTAITVGHPSILGFSAAGGAVIPSFGGGGLGGGTIGIVHPNEMILDPRLSEFVQRAAASASDDFGGGSPIVINQNNTIGAGANAGSLRLALRAHANDIADAVMHSIRSGRATGQNVHHGAFRR